MKSRTRRFVVALVGGALVVTAAAAGMAGTDTTADEMTRWGIPPQETVVPQTDAQDEYNKEHGRPLPKPELLQPGVESTIASYTPLNNRSRLRGTYGCGASDVLADLSKRWVDEFEQMYPKVTINVDPPYAGSLGALALIDGKLDCVFVSRELKPTDVTSFREAFGYDPSSVPISGGTYRHFGFLDSMGFVVNKDNPLDKMTLDQLDAIFSSTRLRGGEPIETWGDLGLDGEWADKPIHIYGLKPWNGFEEFVRQRVISYNGRRGEWRSAEASADGSTPADPNVSWDTTVFKLAEHVKDDPYGIAYTGMAYVDQPVKVLALADHAGAPTYAPTYENVASAEYPLSRLVYMNFNKVPGRQLDPVLEELTKFLISKQGQKVVSKQQVFLPLRERQTQESMRILRSLP